MMSTRIALFGDSYFVRLGKYCNFDMKVPGQVRFIAKSGLHVRDDNSTLRQQLQEFKPHVVFICAGGNDISSCAEIKPKHIIDAIISLACEFKRNGTQTVYVYAIAERGKFRFDKELTPKSFNAQRKKINKELRKCKDLKLITPDIRYPAMYEKDGVHYNDQKGNRNLFHHLRRIVFQHKKT